MDYVPILSHSSSHRANKTVYLTFCFKQILYATADDDLTIESVGYHTVDKFYLCLLYNLGKTALIRESIQYPI